MNDRNLQPDPDGMAQLRADAERIIARAAALPLKDAAFELWLAKDRLDDGLLPPMTVDERRIAQATPMAAIMAKIQHERDHAQDGPTFDRLKQAHPQASDTELKAAIVAAIRFQDDLSNHYSSHYRADLAFGERIDGALSAARRKNHGYLETTYRRAGHWLVFVMK